MELEFWDKETSELIQKHMEPEMYSKLTEIPVEEKRLAEDACEEAAWQCKNPKLRLYIAIKRAEKRSSTGNILKVAHRAAEMNDFVTALYWHEKTTVMSLDLDGQFERRFFKICAERQKREDPSAEPVRSSRQMSSRQTKISQMLRSTDYPKLEYAVRLKEHEIYQKSIDKFEADAKLAKKRIDKADNMGCLGWLLTLAAALALLIYTVPEVWMWFKNFFLEHLFPLLIFFWVLPMVYIILVVVLAFKFANNMLESGKEAKEKEFKQQLKRREKELQEFLQTTEEYEKLVAIDPGLPKEFQSYGNRLALAELSELEGEEDIKQLVKLWKKSDYSSWTKRIVGENETRESAICRLLESPSESSDILLAVALFFKEKNTYLHLSYWTGEQIAYRRTVPAEEGSCMLREMIDGARNMGSYRSPYEFKRVDQVVSRYCESFLMELYQKAKTTYDNALLGEVCYYLYYLYDNCHLDGRKEKCYSYGREGIDHSSKLKYEVMTQAAYDNETKERRLGYTRRDVENYVSELKRKGDPLEGEFRKTLEHATKLEKKQKEFDEELAKIEAAKRREFERQLAEQKEAERLAAQRADKERVDMDSPFSAINMPDVITGPYQRTYRKLSGNAFSADYVNDLGEMTTIHDSDIKVGVTGYSAKNSDGYFYW